MAAGYNARDAEEYVSSYSAQVNHPNAALYPRYGGAFPIVLAVTNMVIQVLTMSPLRAMTNNAGAAMEVFKTAYVSIRVTCITSTATSSVESRYRVLIHALNARCTCLKASPMLSRTLCFVCRGRTSQTFSFSTTHQ